MIHALILAIMGALMSTRGYGDGEMIPLLKRHEIQVLLKAEHVRSQSEAVRRSIR